MLLVRSLEDLHNHHNNQFWVQLDTYNKLEFRGALIIIVGTNDAKQMHDNYDGSLGG